MNDYLVYLSRRTVQIPIITFDKSEFQLEPLYEILCSIGDFDVKINKDTPLFKKLHDLKIISSNSHYYTKHGECFDVIFDIVETEYKKHKKDIRDVL